MTEHLHESPVESLDAVLRPRSIAVVGASRNPARIGYQVLKNLVHHGYAGTVYPVNPTARAVLSIRAFPSVDELPEPVDLAVIVVPAEQVVEVAEACGRRGVKALVVISAGFREVGPSGVEREKALMDVVRSHGMRLVGPNCMGVLNTAPDVAMNGTFAPSMPPAGPISFMSQSGALGVTVLDYAAEYGIGISQFVSVGNKPDVSGNDLIRYWDRDERTRVILLYVENFGNPRQFTRLARRITRRKPIAVVKSGRSRVGARAASSHTGSLAGADVATDALLAQCGVIRVDTVEQLFDLALAFAHQPVPRGSRVGIVTNAGGPGILIADACEANGLDVVDLAEETRSRLAERLPPEATIGNPVDMIATATAETYRFVVEMVLADPGVDMVIASFVPPVGVEQTEVATAIARANQGNTMKPVVAVLMGRAGFPAGLVQLREAGIPGYRFPESAVGALGAMNRQRAWLARPDGTLRNFDVDGARVAYIIDRLREEGREQMLLSEAMRVFEAYGIPVSPYRTAGSADEAVEAAEHIGFPVVLKASSPRLVHKSDAGGVVLNLRDAPAVRDAYEAVAALVRDDAGGEVVVQGMAQPGHELIIGVTTDPAFGPLLMFGLGGVHVEVLKDVAFRIHPLSDIDAHEMVRSIRGLPILEGTRGGAAADLAGIEEVLQRISQLVGDHPAIAQLDVNPWLAHTEGGVAVDARITLGG